MIVVAAVCLVVAVGLGIALVRTRTRLGDLEVALRTTIGERDGLELDLEAARDEAAAATRARDDAAARVQRARRDAADVAARLRDETEARAGAESDLATVTNRCEALEGELAEARSAIDERVAELEDLRSRPPALVEGSIGSESLTSLLWDLALGRAERTWRTSISLGLDEASPLTDSPHPLRTAIEIEIDAAREEAGADIDLRWTGDEAVPTSTALVVLAVVESVVAAVAKVASSTTLEVSVAPDAVAVRFEAVDDAGGPIALDVPGSDPAAPGHVVVPVDGAGG